MKTSNGKTAILRHGFYPRLALDYDGLRYHLRDGRVSFRLLSHEKRRSGTSLAAFALLLLAACFMLGPAALLLLLCLFFVGAREIVLVAVTIEGVAKFNAELTKEEWAAVRLYAS